MKKTEENFVKTIDEVTKTSRKASVHGTITSFKGVVEKLIESELISDESKQQLLAIKDEAVLRYIEKLKI